MNIATYPISAEDELLRLGVKSWRTQLIGFALTTLAVAWAFYIGTHISTLWIWVALQWSLFVLQSYLFLRLDSIPLSAPVPFRWWCISQIIATNIGILWGSLPWWLPADKIELQVLAGFFTAMITLGSAGSSNSRKLLLCTVIPSLILIPATMLLRASSPSAAGVSALLMLLVLQRGMGLQRIRVDAITLRREADALTEKLRIEQEKNQEAVRKQAILNERQRLMIDMHDGLGSALMSTLAAVEQGNMTAEQVAEAIRDCISDLRLVIDSLEPLGNDLEVLLATIRHRLGQKLQIAGLKLQWQIDDLPKLPWMESPQALQIMRIVQEILTNIIKHAHASEIYIAAFAENIPDKNENASAAILIVKDNGVGFDSSQNFPGRGLKHLNSRSQALGIELNIHSEPNSGTQIKLRLPTVKNPAL